MGVALSGWLMSACGDGNLTPSVEPEVEQKPPPVLTEVRLPLLQVEAPFRFDTEFRGLATLALEMGLADLPGVVPRLPGDLAAPSTLFLPGAARRQVDARFVARGGPDALELELELCIPGDGCASTTATATRERPWDALATLLEGAAATLALPVDPAVAAAWRTPGSKDPYAELLTGRAAATLLGLLPPPDLPGDKKQDPVRRAVFLDPNQPLAQWTLARWELASTPDGGLAIPALTRALLNRPGSPVLAADLATAHQLTGRPDQALLVWEEVGRTHADDPRFLEPTAATLLAVDRAREARELLDRLPAEFGWDPGVAELRVAVVEAEEGTAALDPLLARWQQTDSRAVEPVRRRVDLRVRGERYPEALELLPALHTRAPGPQTDALEVALLVAVGRPLDAAALAPDEVGARLRARAGREADPGAAAEGLPDGDLDALLARADAALWRTVPGEALAAAEAALSAAPTRAEAWAAKARALDALGDATGAADAYQRAWELDPASDGGPVSADRVASTFRYVEVTLPVAEQLTGQTGGAKGPEL